MSMPGNIKAGISPLLDLVYPPRCPLCGVAVAEHGGLCIECWGSLETASDPACASCGKPLARLKADPAECWDCEQRPPKHSGIIAACLYNDVSRDLVLRFKHGGKITLARLMARMMATQFDTGGAEQAALLIPVPLHSLRLWERGYNQSALLAYELARIGKGALCVDALVRNKRTPSLGGLGKDERARVLEGAIAVSAPRQQTVSNRDVLLVDDVYTSGATSTACVDALLNSGARSVKIVCFARVAAA